MHPLIFVDGLRLLTGSSACTIVVEHAHGVAANIKRSHLTCGHETLRYRAALSTLRPLLFPAFTDLQIERILGKIAKLDEKQPERIGARQMFFGERALQHTRSPNFNTITAFVDMQPIMASHFSSFGNLSLGEQVSYYEKVEEYRSVVIAQHKHTRDRHEAAIAKLFQARDQRLAETGLTNHMHSCANFSDNELDSLLKKIIEARRVAPNDRVFATRESSPKGLCFDEEVIFKEAAVALPPFNPLGLPQTEWMREVARNRDRWRDTAICDKDCCSEHLYLMLFAKQSPQLVYFFRTRKVARNFPSEHAAMDFRPEAFKRYTCYPLDFLPDAQLGISDYGDIDVYTRLQWERGGFTSAYHSPVSFEDFVRFHPRSVATRDNGRAAGRGRVKESVIDELLAANPWLDREDFFTSRPTKHARRKTALEPSTDSDSMESADDVPDEPMLADDAVAVDPAVAVAPDVVQAEIANLRHEVAEYAPENSLYFSTRCLTGAGYILRGGGVLSAVRGQANALAVEWCQRYGFAATQTYNLSLYGREGAARFVAEFCRQITYFIRLYLASLHADGSFVYSQQHVDDHVSSDDFVAYLGTLPDNHRGIARAEKLWNISPRPG
eukprot:TRINITY_DN18103_c0_g1_i1.p1 TRINITY_DN18103_c0_g1~~TRINITY_DN18103_c0_g1_i1.p1  ORF type:complete len:621 (+),score=52.09 TRINITY_DN18103_c0_g1_i1:31-1863(+)